MKEAEGPDEGPDDPVADRTPPIPPHLFLGRFISRPNRFLAYAWSNGRKVNCHMPNPGRMKELLVPGAALLLEKRDEPGRRTGFKVVGVWYARQWVSLDSTRGNDEVARLIEDGKMDEFAGCTRVRREVPYGGSRFDMSLEGPEEADPDGPGADGGKTGGGNREADDPAAARTGRRWLVEVKTCTLVEGGHARFPDAPTTRGAHHMDLLARAVDDGWNCAAVVFIPRRDAVVFTPNDTTDPDFGVAMRRAADAGVRVIALRFGFDGTGMEYLGRVRVVL